MIALRGGTVVTPDGLEKKDLYIDGEKIAAASGPADRDLDTRGCFLFPGFIDSHTHFQMPVSGTWTADDFASGTAAAAAGGTTVILDFATQDKGDTLRGALDVWHGRADGHCSCDYGFHMAVTDWNEETKSELPKMLDEGVSSFKAYMAYDALRLTDGALFALLAQTGEMGCWLGVHCELGDEVNRRVAQLLADGCTAPMYHPVSRPNEVEAAAIRRLMELAEKARGLPWVVHLSTREGLSAIEAARQSGQRVLVETCPQYLTLTDTLYAMPGFEGAKYVCSPPLRSLTDADALWGALANREVNIISTDHCSFNFKKQKELGLHNFSKIPNGLPGVELRPALLWTYGVSDGTIRAEDMCRMLSTNPARAFGMYPRKGCLEPGSDADVVIWDPAYAGRVQASEMETHCDYSPWDGFDIRGRARAVYLRGELVAENGKCVKKGSGKFIPRKPNMLEKT